MQFRSLLTIVAISSLRSGATLYEDISSLSSLDGYDFIVVGGGIAGCVLANRLSENANSQVLLLEAGPSDRNNLDLQVPYYVRRALAKPGLQWNSTYIPQPGLNGRAIPFIRGFVLGGSSSINGMVYTRGSADDYNRYAEFTGDPGWSWDALQPYFRKVERFVLPTDGHDITDEYDPSVHGIEGMMGISLHGHPLDIDPLIMKAANELGGDYRFVLDQNAGIPIGIGWAQNTIRNGTRESAASSYLADEYLERPNLHVLVHAHVRRVLWSNDHRVIGSVELTQGGNTHTLHKVSASKEVVLCAGAMGTPDILLKSGIGSATVLSSMKILVVRDLPSVGQNASEQTYINVQWHTNSTDNFNHILLDSAAEQKALEQWKTNRTGPLGNGARNHLVWLRLNESDPEVQDMLAKYGDPAAGALSPHIEFMPDNGIVSGGSTGEYSLDLQAVALNPRSRGTVTLNFTDPFGPPLADAGFYTHPFDLFVQKQAIRAAIHMTTAPTFKDYIVKPYTQISAFYHPNGTIDDKALEDYIRSNTKSNIHMVGSASMSPRDAEWGVVNPDLKVKGLNGLRIVDASVFPFCPAGHTQAPVYVLAERAADIIKKEYS